MRSFSSGRFFRAVGLILLVLVLGIRPGCAADVAAKSSKPLAADFNFKLSAPALTSAGVFDGQGRLVQVLWNRRQFPAGEQSGHWDGQDQFHDNAPAGDYEFRVVMNRATYKNVGAIGNSGRAPTPEAHTPAAMASVAIDAKGAIYTANGWDEAGADFKKWDAEGNAIYDGRYQMRNGNPNGAPYSIAVDDTTIYCGMEGWASVPWNHKQQVQRFALSDGKLQTFTARRRQVRPYPNLRMARTARFPPARRAADAELMRMPLRAIAVAGDSLLVADALAGKVRRYHKSHRRSPRWFRRQATHGTGDRSRKAAFGSATSIRRVSVFSPEGKPIARVLQNLGEDRCLGVRSQRPAPCGRFRSGANRNVRHRRRPCSKGRHIRPKSGCRRSARRIISFSFAAWQSIRPDIW